MKKLIVILFGILSMTAQAAEVTYRLIEPKSSDVVGCWIKDYKNYSKTVGYSSLGHVFLFSPKDSHYAVFYPFKGAAKSYGAFTSVQEFEKKILLEPGFSGYVLRHNHVKKLHSKLGKLKKNQIYIPRPYPFIGGDESVGSYSKGDIWVMLSIVSQMRDDC